MLLKKQDEVIQEWVLTHESSKIKYGGLAEIKKFNEGGVNYLPSKVSHDENDANNYVRASGYVEDGAGVGDKDEDTMLAQLADGEFVTRADGVLGAGIIAGANPNSMKDMREKGAQYFYEQQKRYKRVFDLLKDRNGTANKKQIKPLVSILPLEPKDVERFWPLAEFMVAEALAFSGKYADSAWVIDELKKDMMQCWIMFGSDEFEENKVFGICVGRIGIMPNYNQYEIVICTGKRRELWEDNLIKLVTDFARLTNVKELV